jgi:hypothetical protein
MKDPENKDLIRQMKQVLHQYEEPYIEGAWEKFSQGQKSTRLPYWRWSAVAALIFLVGSIWLISSNQTSTKTSLRIVQRKPSVLPPANQSPERKTATLDNLTHSEKQVRIAKHVNSQIPRGVVSTPELQRSIIALNNTNSVSSFSNVPRQIVEAEIIKEKTGTVGADKTMDFLLDQAKLHDQGKMKEATTKLKSESRWDFGVEVLPTMSDAAFSVGAGLTSQYKLTEHFSVGSGISYVGIQAGKSVSAGVSLLSSKQLQSVDANIRGIDIPLNVVYNINKKLYTAVGVSYFNVIKEDRKNTFVSERQVSASSTDPVTGLAATTRTFVSEVTQEPAAETLLNGKSYLGFFNFSIGRKQEVFKKYNIFIEPFIKVPVGKLSQQELKLMNGGMKFRVAF